MQDYLLAIIAIILLITLTIMAFVYLLVPVEREWEEMSYVVQSGDTIWGICCRYRPDDMLLEDYMRLFRDTNRLWSDTTIYPGETLVILIEKN